MLVVSRCGRQRDGQFILPIDYRGPAAQAASLPNVFKTVCVNSMAYDAPLAGLHRVGDTATIEVPQLVETVSQWLMRILCWISIISYGCESISRTGNYRVRDHSSSELIERQLADTFLEEKFLCAFGVPLFNHSGGDEDAEAWCL